MAFFDDAKKSISDDKIPSSGGLTSTGSPLTSCIGKQPKEMTEEERTAYKKGEGYTQQIPTYTPEQLDKIVEDSPEDAKGNKIIPDDIFDQYYKQLPAKCVNQSGTWRTSGNGGKLIILGGDPERDKEIHRLGAETLNATHAQRRSMAETLDILLRQTADLETAEQLNLPTGATKQDALLTAMYLSATEGNVKAGQFIRDTIGEQPTAKQDINLAMTDDDKKLLEKVENRLNQQD